MFVKPGTVANPLPHQSLLPVFAHEADRFLRIVQCLLRGDFLAMVVVIPLAYLPISTAYLTHAIDPYVVDVRGFGVEAAALALDGGAQIVLLGNTQTFLVTDDAYRMSDVCWRVPEVFRGL